MLFDVDSVASPDDDGARRTARPTGTKTEESGGFFEKKAAAAVLKHGIISRYIKPFASKVGKNSDNHVVAYLDGYAGQGVYNDGSPGSPVLAARTAQSLADIREVRGYYVEKDGGRFDRLKNALEPYADGHTRLFPGDVEDYIDAILADCFGLPLLAVIDPSGLGLSFDSFERKLLARSLKTGAHHGGPITDVIMTIQRSALRRHAGALTSQSTDPLYVSKTRPSVLSKVDRTLGGDWWRSVWTDSGDQREDLIIAEYIKRLAATSGGWSTGSVGVRNHVDGAVIYDVVMLTKSLDGLWLFAEAVSSAQEEWRRYLAGGQDALALDDPNYVSEISANIRHLLRDTGEFRVLDKMLDVFGTTIGLARGKHVRTAIKELHAQGITSTNGKGSHVEKLWVRRPS